jgi:formamidopyrimidine-DNA glycosylase
MPELPDVLVYIESLESRVVGSTLEKARLLSPFVLRSVAPPFSTLEGSRLEALRRLGKRIVFCFSGDLFLVVHLMIAGRFQWKPRGKTIGGRIALAAFDFPSGTLFLTEAGSKRRASLYIVQGEQQLAQFDRGALEVLSCTPQQFAEALQRENHTVKRSLTDPRLFSGIGNAYSDEILHRARLSPMKLTSKLTDVEIASLSEATRSVLNEWIERLRAEAAWDFPSKVTAFRPEMAVHGKYGEPCPLCGSPVQRIVYAENECNYCATCQTGGRLLADRAMSRLLKADWPRSLDEWDAQIEKRRSGG